MMAFLSFEVFFSQQIQLWAIAMVHGLQKLKCDWKGHAPQRNQRVIVSVSEKEDRKKEDREKHGERARAVDYLSSGVSSSVVHAFLCDLLLCMHSLSCVSTLSQIHVFLGVKSPTSAVTHCGNYRHRRLVDSSVVLHLHFQLSNIYCYWL